MIEVCIYGRGGQGGVTLAELVAHAAISEGKHAQSMPSFGPVSYTHLTLPTNREV